MPESIEPLPTLPCGCEDADVDGVCPTCEGCTGCCSCITCSQCDRRFEEDDSESIACPRCDGCTYCCQCAHCENCNVAVEHTCTNCNRCTDACCNCYSCGNCGEMIYSRDYHSNCDRCRDCCQCAENEDDEGNGNINDYSYRPSPLYFRAEQEKHTLNHRYYGIELEVNGAKSLSDDILNKMNSDSQHVYLKEDGSLSTGFEIVTHPHTFKAMRKFWLKYFKNPVRGLTSFKTGECGLHIHISRASLSNAQIRRMVVFLNAPENYSFVARVAQRDSSSYAKIKTKKITHIDTMSDEDKYEALNLMHRKTIELRIFRGSYRVDRVLKGLDFADCLVEFSLDRSYQELTEPKFMEFLEVRKAHYKFLYSFLTGKPLPLTEKPSQVPTKGIPVQSDIFISETEPEQPPIQPLVENNEPLLQEPPPRAYPEEPIIPSQVMPLDDCNCDQCRISRRLRIHEEETIRAQQALYDVMQIQEERARTVYQALVLTTPIFQTIDESEGF